MTLLNLCHHFGNGFEIKPEIFGYIDVGEGFWKRIMLVTDPLCFYISLGHQHLKDFTKIEILSPTLKNVSNFESPTRKLSCFDEDDILKKTLFAF